MFIFFSFYVEEIFEKHFLQREIVTRSLVVFLQCYIFVGLSIVQPTRLHTTYIISYSIIKSLDYQIINNCNKELNKLLDIARTGKVRVAVLFLIIKDYYNYYDDQIK